MRHGTAIDAQLPPVEHHPIAVLADCDLLDADRCRQRGVGLEVSVLAMHRHVCGRIEHVDERSQLVLGRVPRHVDVGIAPVVHGDPQPHEVVDDP